MAGKKASRRLGDEAVQQAEDEARLEGYLTRDNDELDFYWWRESEFWCLHDRVMAIKAQNKELGQLDLFGGD